MKKKNKAEEVNFENYGFYRFIKVVYIFLNILISVCFVFIAIQYKPYDRVNSLRGGIICDNGKKYSFSQARIIFPYSGKASSLDAYGDKNARLICIDNFDEKRIEEAKKIGTFMAINKVTDDYMIERYAKQKNYEVNIFYETKGSWKNVLMIMFGGIVGSYIVLSVIKESLYYIIYGKKFSWEWTGFIKSEDK